MRVSNLQAMAHKDSQSRAAWSGQCCLCATTLAMTVGEGGGMLCDSTLYAQ